VTSNKVNNPKMAGGYGGMPFDDALWTDGPRPGGFYQVDTKRLPSSLCFLQPRPPLLGLSVRV
jgi:hypothetical protein